MRAHSFEMQRKLKPSEIYCAAVGMFETYGYELVEIVEIEKSKQIPLLVCERARIYRNPSNSRLYVLYYPGKDNDKPMSDIDTATPLRQIINEVKANHMTNITRAVNCMIVCESNRYYGFKIDHYVYASIHRDVLTIEDSIDRNYNEKYIDQLCSHIEKVKIKRGWQKRILHNWECGHFVLQALYRRICGKRDPDKLTINEAIVNKHDEYYRLGTQLVNRGYEKPHQTTLVKNIIDQTEYTSSVASDEESTTQNSNVPKIEKRQP